MKRQSLFDTNIPPACEYCAQAVPNADGSMFECSRHGTVSPYFRCGKFHYSPVLRKPRLPQKLPKFTPEDFSL